MRNEKINTANIALRAVDLHRCGRVDEAKIAFESILSYEPENLIALYSMAAIQNSQRQYEDSLKNIEKFLKHKKDFALAYVAKSLSMVGLGRLTLAREALEIALQLEPHSIEAQNCHEKLWEIETKELRPVTQTTHTVSALSLEGLRAQERGDVGQAESLFIQALKNDPNDFIALYSLGVINALLENTDVSIEYLERATTVSNGRSEAYYAYGTALMSKGLYEAAIQNLDKALSLNEKYEEAYVNKSNILHSIRKLTEALSTLERGLTHFPENTKFLNNKGYLLTEIKQYDLAASTFEKLIAINPSYENALGLLAHAKLHACDWRNIEELKQEIKDRVQNGESVTQPFALMSLTDNADLIKTCAKTFGEKKFPQKSEHLWTGENYKHRRKRIAFLSADFREHAVGYLFRNILDKFPTGQFETLALSQSANDRSKLYSYYKEHFDHYVTGEGKTARELAQLLKAFEADIVVDLSGYTSGSRLDVLSFRPAPIQITYLGYPGTLALPYIDYFIADQITIPETLEKHFTERILKLNSCYLPTSTRRPEELIKKIRSAHKLPDDDFVFCSFNHDYKINLPIFEIWMSLLRKEPHSCLWLMKLNDDAQKNLRQHAASFDVNPDRIIFADRVPTLEEHLERYLHADLCLDTFPYNGHTTTFDALSIGVPVITLQGQAFQSRVASSLLNDYGQAEYIAGSYAEYQTTAQSLASKIASARFKKPHLENTKDIESKVSSLANLLTSL